MEEYDYQICPVCKMRFKIKTTCPDYKWSGAWCMDCWTEEIKKNNAGLDLRGVYDMFLERYPIQKQRLLKIFISLIL